MKITDVNIGIFYSEVHNNQTWYLIDLFNYERSLLPSNSTHVIEAGSIGTDVYFFWISEQLLTMLAFTYEIIYYTPGIVNIPEITQFSKILYDHSQSH
jgi:hypothetical protein